MLSSLEQFASKSIAFWVILIFVAGSARAALPAAGRSQAMANFEAAKQRLRLLR